MLLPDEWNGKALLPRKENEVITNILATILASVVTTNWADVYEPDYCNPQFIYTTEFRAGNQTHDCWPQLPNPSRKLIGKTGKVMEVTEIKFDYNGEPQVHRIEKHIETITMKCREKPAELEWDEPVREKVEVITATSNVTSNVTGVATITNIPSVLFFDVEGLDINAIVEATERYLRERSTPKGE